MNTSRHTALRVGLALVLGSLLAAPTLAGLTVSGPFIDDTTGGDWRESYGSCFYMVPDPRQEMTRDFVGPDWFSQDMMAYRYNTCYGGQLAKNKDAQLVDFRIFRDNPAAPRANAWSTNLARPAGSDQFVPCINRARHSTWNNGDASSDPLTVEFMANVSGHATVAYYFTSASHVCRETEVALMIDGIEVASGTVGDIAQGKYVVFDMNGLRFSETGTTFTLVARDAPGDPSCGALSTPAPNTHVSGVFFDSPGACDNARPVSVSAGSPAVLRDKPLRHGSESRMNAGSEEETPAVTGFGTAR